MENIEQFISKKKILLADGATGTNLFALGLEAGASPEMLNLEQPEIIRTLHSNFIDAGSDIILTNTFGANRYRLELHKAEDRVEEINKRAAELANEAAASTDRDIIIAGSVGPTGSLFEPMGELTHDTALEAFKEQIAGLKSGGADVIWIETMSSEEEILAASQAAIDLDMPYCVTVSFDTAGKSMMGLAPEALPELFSSLCVKPVAIGANCGVGASDLLAAMLPMIKANHNFLFIAKANCGIPVIRGDKVVYTGTPELMANYVALAADAGIKIIGGCCGTTFEHIKAMRHALDNYEPGPQPDNDCLRKVLGEFTNPVASEHKATTKRRSRRKRT